MNLNIKDRVRVIKHPRPAAPTPHVGRTGTVIDTEGEGFLVALDDETIFLNGEPMLGYFVRDELTSEDASILP
jgi:hypothetical protein